MSDAPSPHALAQASTDAMFARDHVAHGMGMVVEAVGPGTASVSMTVRNDMVNGLAICHGGMIFTLADTAFAYACNSYDLVTVAQHCSVSFLNPAKLGDRLIATAHEVTRQRRNGLYDVMIATEDGTAIAAFRGHSRSTGGSVIGFEKKEEIG